MKRLLPLILILAALPAMAQTVTVRRITPRNAATTTYVVDWTWTAPALINGVQEAAGYNLYQATGACPSSGIPAGATKIASGDTLTNYTQNPMPSGITCSYVTAVNLAGVEGPPSATFQLDTTVPGAPTNLTGTPAAQ